MNMSPAAPPAPIPLHACFSGALHCSGCNPCPQCREAVKESVVPPAVHASGFGDLATVLFDLVEALRARGIDPTMHLGVQLPPALRSNEEMAIAFFQGFERGWGVLHDRMRSGDLAGRYVLQPVILPPPVPTEPVGAVNAARAEAGLPHVTAPVSTAPVPNVSVARAEAGLGAPPPVSRTAETVAAPRSSPRIEAPIAPAVPPLEAHEIARMVAVPAPPGMGQSLPAEARNGTVNGAGERG